MKTELPKYVSLNGTALRLRGKEYWRDGGLWGVEYKIKDGKLLSSHWNRGHNWLHNVELMPITEAEWRKDNAGYIMTREDRLEKFEAIAKVFAKCMYYGDWKWETPNERVIEMLMREVGLYPFTNEDEMIRNTNVDDELYLRASNTIPARGRKGTEVSEKS